MAGSDGRINFQVGFTTDQSSLSQLKQSLQGLKNLRMMDFGGTRDDLKAVQEEAKTVEKALTAAFNPKVKSFNTQTFLKELHGAGSSIDQVYQKFSMAGVQGQVAFSKMSASILTTNLHLKQTNSLITNFGTTMMNTFKWGIASGFMNTLTGSIQSAFKYTESLQRSLTNIRIVTGDSTDKMSQFADQANRAASELGRSTLDYTKASLTYYQQGLSDEDVQARTEATLKAQNITGAGTEMADYLTSVWNGYKVANEEAELYVDKLAAVADSSASDMSELAVAMSKVASTANTMGVDIDQLNAQIATIVATTRQAPESVGTAFKTIYTRLNDIKTGADEAEISLGNYSGKMADLGFNVLDQNGHLRDTGQIMEEIGSKWETLTRQQQIYLATTMGGQRQVNQLMALFGNWTTYSELLNTSLESQGTLAEKNARYMESLGAKMEQLGAAGERVKRALIDADDMKGLVGMLGSATNLIANFFESFGSGTNVLLAFGGIFTQMFSGVIGKQINSLIVNMQAAKQNLVEMQRDVDQTLDYAAKNSYNVDAVEAMITAKQQLYKVWDVMSADQIGAFNQQIQQLGAAKDAQAIAKNTLEAFDKLKQHAQQAGKAITEIENTTRNMSFKGIESGSQEMRDIYDDLLKKAQEFQKSIGGQGVNTAIDGIVDKYSNLKEQIRSSSNVVGQFRKEILQASGQVGQLLTTNRSDLQFNLSQSSKAAQRLKDDLQKAIEAKQQLVKVDNIVNLAGALGQVAGSVRSLLNLPNIWKNENISGGEKLLQTITSLSFTIPSLIRGYQGLRKVLGLTAAQQLKKTTATIAQKAAENAAMASTALKVAKEKLAIAVKREQQIEQMAYTAGLQGQIITDEMAEAVTKAKMEVEAKEAIVKKAQKDATDAATISTKAEAAAAQAAAGANKKFLATLWANPIAQAAIIIGGLVLAYDALTLSAKQANKEVEKSQDQYDKENQKLTDISSKLDEVQNKIDELNSKDKLSFTDQDELIRLQAQKAELQALEVAQRKLTEAKQKDLAIDIAKKAGTGFRKADTYQQNNNLQDTAQRTVGAGANVSDTIKKVTGVDLTSIDSYDTVAINDLLQRIQTAKQSEAYQGNINSMSYQDLSSAEKFLKNQEEKSIQQLNKWLPDMKSELHTLMEVVKNDPSLEAEYKGLIEFYQTRIRQAYQGSGSAEAMAETLANSMGFNEQGFKELQQKVNSGDANFDKIFKDLSQSQQRMLQTWSDETGMSVEDILKIFGKLDWESMLKVKQQEEAIEREKRNLANLTEISNTGEKYQNGKNVGLKEGQTYQNALNDTITDIKADTQNLTEEEQNHLIKQAELLKETWLAGTEEYKQALKQIEDYKFEGLNQKLNQVGFDNMQASQIEALERYANTRERVNKLNVDATTKQNLLNKVLQNEAEKYGTTASAIKQYAKQLEKSNKVYGVALNKSESLTKQFELESQSLEKIAINDHAVVAALEKIQKVKVPTLEMKENDPLQYTKVIDQLVTYLNEIPGLLVTPEDVQKNLGTIKKVAEGDNQALYQLRLNLAQQMPAPKVDVEFAEEQQTLLTDINNYIHSLSPDDIESHAYLNDADFIANLMTLASKSEAMATYVNQLMANLGAQPYIQSWKNMGNITQAEAQDASQNAVYASKGSSFGISAPVIGYKPLTSNLPKAPGGGKKSGGGGGGGGGGSEKEPKKEQLIKDERDAYHDINKEISKLEKQFDKLSDAQKRAAGQDAIDLLNEELDIIGKQVSTYEEKIKLIDEERAKLQEQAKTAGYNAIFDPDTGQLSNYSELYEEQLKKVNDVIENYNKVGEQQGAEAQKPLEEELKNAKKAWEDFKDWLSKYDANVELKDETQEAIKAQLEKQLEINIDKFKMKVDIDLDLAEAARDWNEFQRKVIDKLDENDVSKRAKSMLKDLSTYYDDETGAIPSLTEHINNTMEQIERLQDGIDGAYGVFRDGVSAEDLNQALEDLDKYTEDLMSNLEAVEDLIQEVRQAYFDMLDAAQEAFDKQNEEYEFITKMLDHDKNLIDMLYGEKAFDRFDELYKQRDKNNRQQLDFLKQQKGLYWNEVQAMKAARDGVEEGSEAWKQYNKYLEAAEEKWMSAVEAFNSQVENSVQNLLDQYDNTLSKIFDDLDKKLTNGHGSEYLSEEWELIKSGAERYLDPIEAAFDISSLQDAFDEALKNTENSIKAQKSLTNLRDAELKKLKEKDKLTKFDLDRAKALLDIEVKRIALEQSKNNTSKLRLRRDSQGNYTYQYVADENATQQAQKEYEEAQRSLYDMSKENYITSRDNFNNALKDTISRAAEIEKNNDYTREEKDNLQKQLADQLNDQWQIYLNARDTAAQDTMDTYGAMYGKNKEDFQNMTKEELNIWLGQFLPGIGSGVDLMIDKFSGPEGFLPTIKNSIGQARDATQDYQDKVKEMSEIAGQDFNKVGEAINDNVTKTETLLDSNDKLIGSYQDEIETVKDVIEQVEGLTNSYDGMRDAALQAAKAAREMYEQIKRAQAAAAQQAVDADDWGVHKSAKKSDSPKYTFERFEGENGEPAWKIKDENGNYVKGQTIEGVHYDDGNGLSYTAGYKVSDEGWVQASEQNPYHNGMFGAIDPVFDSDNVNVNTSSTDVDTEETNITGEDTLPLRPIVGNALSEGDLEKYKDGPGAFLASASSAASGMYTGSWGDSGKLAVLHEKELVLNADDTENILNAVDLVRSLAGRLAGMQSMFNDEVAGLGSVLLQTSSGAATGAAALDQQVHITATFPNVNSQVQIENALNNLVNRASQYAFKSKI